MTELSEPELELALLLLRAHDGDDRCGCLKAALLLTLEGDPRQALDVIRYCERTHVGWSLE